MLTRTRKAFTLLELMVAFVIMAILAAVAIPSLQSIVTNSQLQADQSSALNIAHAAYFNAQSVYPAAATTLGEATSALTSGVSVVAGTTTATDFQFSFAGDSNVICVTGLGSQTYPALDKSLTTGSNC